MAWYEKPAKFVDKILPYLILVLLIIVVIDIFFQPIAIKYTVAILVIDVIIVAFFVADLVFKYLRVRNIPRFLRLYWLDILAVLPFFLLLRLFEELLLITEQSALTLRNLFHAGVILEEEAAVQEAAQAAELLSKEGRIALLLERFAPLRRMPRLLKALSFYEHPSQKKTKYQKKN